MANEMIFHKKDKKRVYKILIVDDRQKAVSEAKRIVTEHMISSYPDIDYRFYSFTSIQSFINNGDFEYDIAIVDWNLGSSNLEKGSTVVDKIKDKCKNITIFSGQTSDISNMNVYCFENKLGLIIKGYPIEKSTGEEKTEKKFHKNYNMEKDLKKFIDLSIGCFEVV